MMLVAPSSLTQHMMDLCYFVREAHVLIHLGSGLDKSGPSYSSLLILQTQWYAHVEQCRSR